MYLKPRGTFGEGAGCARDRWMTRSGCTLLIAEWVDNGRPKPMTFHMSYAPRGAQGKGRDRMGGAVGGRE